MAESVFVLGAEAPHEARAPIVSEFVSISEGVVGFQVPEDSRPVRSRLSQTCRFMADMVSRIASCPTRIEDLAGIVKMAE